MGPVNIPRCVGRSRCTRGACHAHREQTKYSSWPTAYGSSAVLPTTHAAWDAHAVHAVHGMQSVSKPGIAPSRQLDRSETVRAWLSLNPGVGVESRDQQVDPDKVEPERREANDRDHGRPAAAPAGR